MLYSSNFDATMREVQVLAKISAEHQGIVRYNNCWLEQQEFTDTSSAKSSTASEGKESLSFWLETSDNWTEEGDYLFIAMQLCSSTLADYLEQNPRIRDRKEMLELFGQIVDAVSFVHSRDMIHRDLKVNN